MKKKRGNQEKVVVLHLLYAIPVFGLAYNFLCVIMKKILFIIAKFTLEIL